MSYLSEGLMYNAWLVGGDLLPLNALPGLLELGGARKDSQHKAFFTSADYGLKYHVGTLTDFLWNDTLINKTLVAVRWKNEQGQTIYWHLSRTNERWAVTSYLANETTHEIISNSTISLQQQLEFIGDHLGGSHGFSGFVQFQLCKYYDGSEPNINDLGYISCCFFPVEYRDVSPNIGDYAGGVQYIGSFIADSTGNAQEQSAYNCLLGVEHFEPDNPTPSEPTENQNPEVDYRDDNIDFPDIPTDTALSTDFIRLYHLDNAGLTALATDLWDNNFFSNIIKNYDSPFENIISLNILPVAITGTNATVIIGNYETTVTGEAITTQFVDLDGGSCRIDRLRDNQLDFEPARTLSIYIPFIGYRQIDLDDLTGGTAYLKYRLDLLTGNILAMLRIVLDRTSSGRYSHDSVEYYFNGNCATSIPVSGSNYAIQYSNMINGAMSASTGLLTGSISGAVGGMSSINNSKPQYMRSGQLSGNVGFMGQMTAFMLLSSPVPHIPDHARELSGYRSMIYWGFDSLSGYTEIETFHPSADLAKECTEEELEEIEKLLKGGVIF